jgi:phosphoribosylglycinamide formyltransferase 1
MMRVGVLVSGRGSNLAALLEDAARPGAPYEIVVVMSNRPPAPALERARAAGVMALAVDRAAFGDRAAQQRQMLRTLCAQGVELVVTAGFDQILLPEVVAAFPQRILNIHPSLLPAFAGTLYAQEAALAHGVKISGCTVHLVTTEVDSGPIVLQAAVPVHDGDTVESLSARILEQEHRLLPQAVRLMAEGRVTVVGRRTVTTGPGH